MGILDYINLTQAEINDLKNVGKDTSIKIIRKKIRLTARQKRRFNILNNRKKYKPKKTDWQKKYHEYLDSKAWVIKKNEFFAFLKSSEL